MKNLIKRNLAKRKLLNICWLVGIGFCMGWVGCSNSSPSQQRPIRPPQEEPQFAHEGDLYIYTPTDGGKPDTLTRISIEIATTDQEKSQGLMHRKTMPDTLGMLFIFDRSEPRSFWMRNTYLSLDILYIDDQYKIVRIYERTLPLMDTSLPSEHPAQYVLEVAAGFCEKYGVEEGDFIGYERFSGNI